MFNQGQQQHDELAALRDRNEELEILLKRSREGKKQTEADLKAELGIEKARRWREGHRADEMEKVAQTLIEENKALGVLLEQLRDRDKSEEFDQLRKKIHDLNGLVAVLVMSLGPFTPTKEQLEDLARFSDEQMLEELPMLLTVGMLRSAADAMDAYYILFQK